MRCNDVMSVVMGGAGLWDDANDEIGVFYDLGEFG